MLARDRFGIKPLAYRDVGGELTFSSELDALEHGELDLDALDAFLTFNVVPGPLSIFKDIRKLLPGHTLTWQDGRTKIDRGDGTQLKARNASSASRSTSPCGSASSSDANESSPPSAR